MVCQPAMKEIHIGADFSETPVGRYPTDGSFNGQTFRETMLVPALKAALESREKVEVWIDDAEGYGSSFLEESFGGLVRVEGFKEPDLKNTLCIRLEDKVFEIYNVLIWRYIRDAQRILDANKK